MKKWIIALIFLCVLTIPVSAMEFTAPNAPESAQKYMPDTEETFAQGLWHIIKSVILHVRPELVETSGICLSIAVAVILMSILNSLSQSAAISIRLTGAVIIGILLLEPVNSMIRLGVETVQQLSEYGKLLIPVMTAALAAQGGTSSSAALYAGTVAFDTILTSAIVNILIPALYIYLCLSVAAAAVEQDMLKKAQRLIKWAMTWGLKWTLYIFTGYMSITGVISGVVDASAVKAAKLTISGVVPVVGGILADASEAILVSAGIMKNAAGIYGIFAVLAICAGPFLQIGILYLLLKLTAIVCNMLDCKPAASLVEDFSAGMGMVLGMTGTVCVLLLISVVCFMKGIS